MILVTTRAVLLRSFPYSETSQVLHFYTETLGGVGVMGRGVRAGTGKGRSGLDTFAEGHLSVHVKPTRELQTLTDFVLTRPRRALGTDVRRFGGAAVLAELVLRHAAEEANPALFEALSVGLDRLMAVPGDQVFPTLLQEAWGIVSELGYRPVIDACVACGFVPEDELVRFDFAAGGIRCERCSPARGGPRLGPGARAQLRALLVGGEVPALTRPRAHLRLLSDFVTYHVASGRPLPSLQVLDGLLADPAEGPSDPTRERGAGESSDA